MCYNRDKFNYGNIKAVLYTDEAAGATEDRKKRPLYK